MTTQQSLMVSGESNTIEASGGTGEFQANGGYGGLNPGTVPSDEPMSNAFSGGTWQLNEGVHKNNGGHVDGYTIIVSSGAMATNSDAVYAHGGYGGQNPGTVGAKATVQTMQGGTQTVVAGGTGTVQTMSGGTQTVLTGATDTVQTMSDDKLHLSDSALYADTRLTIDGGAGDDTILIRNDAEHSSIDAGGGHDSLYYIPGAHESALPETVTPQSGGWGNIEVSVYAGADNDSIWIRNDVEHSTIDGGEGHDSIYIARDAHRAPERLPRWQAGDTLSLTPDTHEFVVQEMEGDDSGQGLRVPYQDLYKDSGLRENRELISLHGSADGGDVQLGIRPYEPSIQGSMSGVPWRDTASADPATDVAFYAGGATFSAGYDAPVSGAPGQNPAGTGAVLVAQNGDKVNLQNTAMGDDDIIEVFGVDRERLFGSEVLALKYAFATDQNGLVTLDISHDSLPGLLSLQASHMNEYSNDIVNLYDVDKNLLASFDLQSIVNVSNTEGNSGIAVLTAGANKKFS